MRGERYKITAGLLTLAVHALFIAVLYFGVKWQMHQPEGMQVDLWSELPQAGAVPPPPPAAPPPRKTKIPRPQAEKTRAAARADIVMAKKKKAEKARKQKQAKLQKLSKMEEKRAQADMKAMEQMADQSDQQQIKAQSAQAARAQAAIASEMEKYKALISSKIRNNVVMPPNVPDDAKAVVEITLLPDGSVKGEPTLVTSSGYPVYDAAIIRAILKAGALPLPKDATTRGRFISPNVLTLAFRAGD